jgi:hypothetical protein
MQDLIRSRTLWAGLLCFAAFVPLAAFIPPSPLFEFLHGIRIAIGLVVLLLFAPPVFQALRTTRLTDVLQLRLGITLNAFSLVMTGVWLILWRANGFPRWMVQSDFNAWLLWLQILGYTLHITAPAATPGAVPAKSWAYVGAAFVAGFAFALFMAWVQPDLTAIVDVLQGALD